MSDPLAAVIAALSLDGPMTPDAIAGAVGTDRRSALRAIRRAGRLFTVDADGRYALASVPDPRPQSAPDPISRPDGPASSAPSGRDFPSRPNEGD
jgi:hypothetical protein